MVRRQTLAHEQNTFLQLVDVHVPRDLERADLSGVKGVPPVLSSAEELRLVHGTQVREVDCLSGRCRPVRQRHAWDSRAQSSGVR